MGGTQSKGTQTTVRNPEKSPLLLNVEAYKKLTSGPNFLLGLLRDEKQSALINPNMKFKSDDGSTGTFLSRIASAYNDNQGNDYEECVRLMIERKADVNAIDNRGNTPLHISVYKPENAPLTKLLLKNGANANCKNSNGQTPLHYAANFLPVVDYQDPDSFLQTNVESILLLLQHNAKVNEKDNHSFTPFQIALQSGSQNGMAMAELLIFYGADINANEGKYTDVIPVSNRTNDSQGLIQKYQGKNPYSIFSNCKTQSEVKEQIDDYLKFDFHEKQIKIDGLISVAFKLNSNETSRNTYQDFISVVKEKFPDKWPDKEKKPVAPTSTFSLSTESSELNLTEPKEKINTSPRPGN